MDADNLRILLQNVISVLLAFGIGALMLAKPALFIRWESWKTEPFALAVIRICGLIMIGLGIAMILKDLGILF
ncbi:MAG: hypothetical protein K2P08_04500 [Oscillospiraceae bacterium]|nr:hypothetical protein [Oscillospiraceae bacterium]